MIAKIMTVGPDRRIAIDRMRRALDEVGVTGIQTTLPFDRALFRDSAFTAGDISTDWVDQHWDGGVNRVAASAAAARAAAEAVSGGRSASTRAFGDPREALGGAVPSLRKDEVASPWRIAGRTAAPDRWPR
jgi:acetyl/propionyl-CoA carboxylase alpha subunit